MNTQAHNFCGQNNSLLQDTLFGVTASLVRQFAQEKWSILYGELDSWRLIALALIDPWEGVLSAIAWLHQLS
jgi:hypothetical protein